MYIPSPKNLCSSLLSSSPLLSHEAAPLCFGPSRVFSRSFRLSRGLIHCLQFCWFLISIYDFLSISIWLGFRLTVLKGDPMHFRCVLLLQIILSIILGRILHLLQYSHAATYMEFSYSRWLYPSYWDASFPGCAHFHSTFT